MMPNRISDPLLQLIKSLQKSEKRNFKLYIKRSSAKEDLKIIQLFDAMDKLAEYDEKHLLKKLTNVGKPQLANLKTHLYKQLLASLRLLKSSESIDMQLHEQLDHARILYNKGLYHQSLKILDKVKGMAHTYNQESFLIQVISLEKKIETLYITRSMVEKTEELIVQANEVNEKRMVITQLSNLALQLYTWYIKNGHARNEEDEKGIKQYFREHLPANAQNLTGFYERLYLFQSYCWYAFVRQDFIMYYRYSQKWLDLFDEQPLMIPIETGHYVKALHNLLNAHFDLRNFEKFQVILKRFEEFSTTPLANQHDIFRVHSFIYIYSAKLNWHLMTGTFKEGLLLVPELEAWLEKEALYLDKHRILVFNYKMATLFFGSGDYETSIDYLRRIIDDHVDMRSDLQCYARLLHMMAHYELGNLELIEGSLIRSVYRYMAKMKNLTVIEEEMFKFLRHSFHRPAHQVKTELKQFLHTIRQVEKSRFETRSFAYLDVISWVESKVYEKPMSKVIHDKYLQHKRKGGVKREQQPVAVL